MKITEDTILADILSNYPDAMNILVRHGFSGVACPTEMWATLKAVTENRGITLPQLLEDLNRFFES